MTEQTDYKVKIKDLPNSEVEIEAELAVETIASYRSKALKEISSKLDVSGFRKGHIPEAVVVSKVGEVYILEEAADLAFQTIVPTILTLNKINSIGRPQVTITKIAPGNPIEFKIKTAIMPTVILSDYKKAAKEAMQKKEDAINVTEKEVDDVIAQVRKKQSNSGENNESNGKEGKDKKDEPLPELTDEYVKTLGDFKDILDFKAKIKENLTEEKKSRAKEKKRYEIADKIIADSKISLPEILIESELNKMSAQFEGDLSRMGLKMDDYLKHIKKTPEDMRKQWRADAEKRAKLQLVLNQIALEEKIEPAKEKVEEEVSHLLEHYKDADAERARIYIETVLTNEKVFEFLEKQN